MPAAKAAAADEDRRPPSQIAYGLYHVISFFAYWFGASHFDVDGDGDFDVEDVQAYLDGRRKRGAAPRRAPRAAPTRKISATVPGRYEAQAKAGGVGGIFDTNGDGEVDFQDAVCSKTEGAAEEDIIVERLVKKHELPWFVFLECSAVLALWGGFAFTRGPEVGIDPLLMLAGLDSISPGWSTLRIADEGCNDLRPQIWRWWTYQFTHVGAQHALMNVLLNVLFGIPLETIHGHLRIALMFNVGVMGGACCYFLNDAHTTVVGCSGGCYALVGIHFADLLINWKQKKFRIPVLFLIFVLIAVDVGSYLMSMGSGQVSHSAHVGGAIAGCIIGCMVGKNLKVELWERFLIGVMSCIGLFLTSTCLVWLIVQDGGPRNIWEAAVGQHGWCWIRQVYSPDFAQQRFECVRCGVRECVERWSLLPNVTSVSLAACEQRGFLYDG